MKEYLVLKKLLAQVSIPENREILQRFFKTKKGEYGEGDVFIGVKVPDIRKIAKENFKETSFETLHLLLESEIHEERALATFISVLKFEKTKILSEKKEIFHFYISHRNRINNWDLVDNSTHKIVGPYLHLTQNVDFLFSLADEENMWSKRIAVVSLWYLWREGYTDFGLQLIKKNLQHPHDLMHKANGWMLRELSQKVDEDTMLEFIFENYNIMPRTTLRYAIEKLPEDYRKRILKGDF